MNEFLQLIAKDVNRIFIKENAESFKDLYKDNYGFIGLKSDIIYGHRCLTEKIGNYGNLLIGFYCRSNCLLNLSIGGIKYMSMFVKEGQFIYALNDESVIPITQIHMHDITISFNGHIDAIYAWYPSADYFLNYKEGLWTYNSKNDIYVVYCKGMSAGVKDKTSIDSEYIKNTFEKGFEMPNMYSLLPNREKRNAEEDLYNQSNKRKLM